MTRIVNDDVSAFVSTAVEGYVAAHGDLVAPVHGGVIRSFESPEGQVAVVMGGGSGHFPAFAGWVGPGLSHGGVCGEIFASPSEDRISSVVRAADNGAGVLMLTVNYAGDILNFTNSAEVLNEEGKDVRMVVIADDIASGPSEDPLSRRGIAGSFVVLKLVGAAAEAGADLDEVERVAIAARDSIRTLGIAFTGCTLPGADRPLFTVPEGRMALGLGIHGEPGIEDLPLGTADEVADVIVDRLFAERAPEPGRHVAVLLNGLGTMEPDELHILLVRVLKRIDEAGMISVAPVTGEVMTSLDMAGVSLTLSYLDDELEPYWLAPAHCSAFTRGGAPTGGSRRVVRENAHTESAIEPGSAESSESARMLVSTLSGVVAMLTEQEEYLGNLDAVAGDGDHGAGMLRGARFALAAAESAAKQGAGAATTLDRAGAAWEREAGGTSGALWGGGLRAAAKSLDDNSAVSSEAIADAVSAFAHSIVSKGKASLGEKTMLDSMIPFSRAVEAGRGRALTEVWVEAADASTTAAEETASYISTRGRSKLHGEKSIGTPDPGATSFAMIVKTAGEIATSRGTN